MSNFAIISVSTCHISAFGSVEILITILSNESSDSVVAVFPGSVTGHLHAGTFLHLLNFHQMVSLHKMTFPLYYASFLFYLSDNFPHHATFSLNNIFSPEHHASFPSPNASFHVWPDWHHVSVVPAQLCSIYIMCCAIKYITCICIIYTKPKILPYQVCLMRGQQISFEPTSVRTKRVFINRRWLNRILLMLPKTTPALYQVIFILQPVVCGGNRSRIIHNFLHKIGCSVRTW